MYNFLLTCLNIVRLGVVLSYFYQFLREYYNIQCIDLDKNKSGILRWLVSMKEFSLRQIIMSLSDAGQSNLLWD